MNALYIALAFTLYYRKISSASLNNADTDDECELLLISVECDKLHLKIFHYLFSAT